MSKQENYISSPSKIKTYDLVVVGAGLAGLLSLLRLRSLYPEWNILLLEKENKPLGRLRQDTSQGFSFPANFSYISKELANFLENTLLLDSEAKTLKEFKPRPLENFSYLRVRRPHLYYNTKEN